MCDDNLWIFDDILLRIKSTNESNESENKIENLKSEKKNYFLIFLFLSKSTETSEEELFVYSVRFIIFYFVFNTSCLCSISFLDFIFLSFHSFLIRSVLSSE